MLINTFTGKIINANDSYHVITKSRFIVSCSSLSSSCGIHSLHNGKVECIKFHGSMIICKKWK